MMRRSFSGGGGGGGGGGGTNGGGMLRAVQRAVRTGGTINGAAQDSFSHSSTTKTTKSSTTTGHAFHTKASNNAVSLSSSSPLSTLPLSAAAAALAPATWDSSSESEEWECLEDNNNNNNNNSILFDDYILGPVPSTDEVHHAVSALHQVLEPTYFAYSTDDGLGYKSNEDTSDELTSSINLTHEVLSSSGSVSDWIEPSIHICNSKLLQSYGSNRVYDAFHLLQTEPSIQKMVISLSSDKAVWDAVLNNEAVREIRDSLKQADNGLQAGNSEEGLDKSDSDGTVDVISWIVVNTKEKVLEIVEKIIEFVNEWFQPPEEEKTSDGDTDPFEEKLRTSFFLSIVVLLVVVVARAQCA
ncbi:uncharacterized protein LOC107014368 isoform X2 [Solanum pennellii]|uniref:Uncharacterized protein LOC107014368 isoform X2 n=1 Tax=Solanum pennellii TaxID=28526 RepID=A0ABM1GDW4_SOLPN|nr:uncharacterized protein LOC107014368 isoform X2 [Solanum pennellii]